MDDLITLGNRLGALGFGTLMFLILAGSYFDIWRWGRDVRKLDTDWTTKYNELKSERERERTEWEKERVDYEKRLTACDESTQKWQTATMSALGAAESTVQELRMRRSA
jgi:hypothetical protein